MKNVIMILAVAVSIVSCKNTDKQGMVTEQDARQVAIDSMKTIAVKQHIIDSMRIVNENAPKQKEVVVVHDNVTVHDNQAPAVRQRRKWSGAAKGAVIGAGVGAVTGAIISKKKGEGAIIGGLAGAAVGAGTGAVIDGKKKQ